MSQAEIASTDTRAGPDQWRDHGGQPATAEHAATQATAPSDTGDETEIPPTTDNDQGDAGDVNGTNPSPSDEPAPNADPSPSDQPAPGPADDASGGGEVDQPSPSPSVAPSPSPSPSPSPTAQVWENHDTLTLTGAGPASGTPLQPGATASVQFVYTVTTPRTGTTIHAELRPVSGDASGWQVRLTSLDDADDDWSAAGPMADATESATTEPDSTFALTISVHAPSGITAPSAVALFMSSSSTTPDGTAENGAAGDSPLAQVQVVLPPSPSPSPTSTSASTPVTTPATPVVPPANSTELCSASSPQLPIVQTDQSSFGNGQWNGASYPELTATVTVTLSLPRGAYCLAPSWTLAVVASPMTSESGGTIPVSSLTYQGIRGLTPPGLSASGLPAGTVLDTPQTIASGTGKTLDSEYPSATLQIAVQLSPPSDAPPGRYIGTITVESSAAP